MNAVYTGDLNRTHEGSWKASLARSVAGFALRFLALVIVAATLYAALAAASVALPAFLEPVEENPILIPTPWSGEAAA